MYVMTINTTRHITVTALNFLQNPLHELYNNNNNT